MEIGTEVTNCVDQLIIEGGPMARNQKVVVQKMALNKIKLGKNSRMSVSKEELGGLMQSIKEVGLLQPIGVSKNGSGYEICYGNRRFMACSRLGFTHIPVILHERKKESDIDIKNLTENIQRRNISLSEAGRYIRLLESAGLEKSEIAVRLGVQRSYIDGCLKAFNDVPDRFKDDIEINVTGRGKTKRRPGKISVSTSSSILIAKRKLRLNTKQTELLFEAAKKDDFNTSAVAAYARAASRGATSVSEVLESAPKLKNVNVHFLIKESELDRIEEKHVINGPFKSLSDFFRAVLRGEKSERINAIAPGASTAE